MTGGTPSSYRFGPFHLDVREQRLLRDGRVVPLTPKIFDVLRVLVEHAGHLVEKAVLLHAVWPGSFVEEGALNRSVSVLRKVLGDHPSGRTYIETVPKRGYRFIAPVTSGGDDTAAPAAAEAHVALAARASHARWPIACGFALAGLLAAAGAWTALARSRGATDGVLPPAAPVHRQVTFTGRDGAPALSHDGRHIAYVSRHASGKTLIVQALDGGSPLAIFSAPEIGNLRWSPDGSELLMWARGGGTDGIYVVPHLGGTPRAIAPGQFTACWSPDGSSIAVAGYLVGKIWLFDTRGRQQRTLTLLGDHWSIWDLDWSSLDRLLAASSDRQGRYTIWTIGADGTRQTTILSASAEIRAARWAPDGDAIYYFRRVDQTVSLYRMAAEPADGTAAASGTALMSGLETDPSFALSGDATRLVYARAQYHSNLWMLDAHRQHATPLTHGTSLIERPRVSPDGRSVVFNVGHEPLTNLYTMPIAGGTPRQLTFLDGLTVGGAWSADGRSIAFASTQGGRPRIWTIAAEGGPPRALPSGDLSDTLDVAWSPGRRIMYQRAGNSNYYELDPHTASKRLLVGEGAPGWMFAPVYSPDGRRVAVMWNRRPERGIWIIDANDQRERVVYPSAAGSIMPIGWSADGAFIYAAEGKTGAFRGATSLVGETMIGARIIRIPSGGGAIDTVTSIPAEEIGSVSMTRDGRRFVYPVFANRSDVWVVDDFDASYSRVRRGSEARNR